MGVVRYAFLSEAGIDDLPHPWRLRQEFSWDVVAYTFGRLYSGLYLIDALDREGEGLREHYNNGTGPFLLTTEKSIERVKEILSGHELVHSALPEKY